VQRVKDQDGNKMPSLMASSNFINPSAAGWFTPEQPLLFPVITSLTTPFSYGQPQICLSSSGNSSVTLLAEEHQKLGHWDAHRTRGCNTHTFLHQHRPCRGHRSSHTPDGRERPPVLSVLHTIHPCFVSAGSSSVTACALVAVTPRSVD
jgi:hypothetical protein